MDKRERYTTNQIRIKARAIARILAGHKKIFVELLQRSGSKSGTPTETKADATEVIVDAFVAKIASDIPDYLTTALPAIMREAAKEPIQRYHELLPVNYSLAFDIETSPASRYLASMRDLMLSEKQGSILLTTKDQLRTILSNGVAQGASYSDIAKQINLSDPFVFSKTRAKIIAVNEVGRAYGFANHEPGRVLSEDGYVLEKQWTTSHDEKVRPTHSMNEGEGKIAFDKPFSGTGDEYAPSSIDINCRCTSTHEIVGVKKGLLVWNVRGLDNYAIKAVHEKARSKSV